MNAGRELDALIEEKVFGRCHHEMEYVGAAEMLVRCRIEVRQEWIEQYEGAPPEKYVADEAASRAHYATDGDYPAKECKKCGASAYGTAITPKYSTDIAAAWQVVEKMRAAWTVTLMTYGATVCCELEQGDSNDPDPAKYGRDRQPYRWAEEMAQTAPLAICRAALRAVGVQ